MNITRRLLAPIAFVLGAVATLTVVPHPHVDRLVTALAELIGRVAGAAVHVGVHAASALTSNATAAWIVVGLGAVLVVASRLAMGWTASDDESEGFDIR